jgi:hypothetical protein
MKMKNTEKKKIADEIIMVMESKGIALKDMRKILSSSYKSVTERMTSSKPTKVGSFHSQEKRKKMTYNNRTTLTVAPRKPLKQYINEQEGKDLFEYSVFGSPQQKVGNFTGQQKLERWSH